MGKTDVNAQAERMLDAYGGSVLRLAYTYLHNRAGAEEVLQDTLVQFLRTAPELQGSEHEKAWLLHVAANLSKNRIKYNKLRQTDELPEELAAEERNDLSFVWEAARALPENCREAVYRMAPGTEDVSGDYNAYAHEAEIAVDGQSVMLKGDDAYTLALWNDGKFSFSLSLSEGFSEAAWRELMQ